MGCGAQRGHSVGWRVTMSPMCHPSRSPAWTWTQCETLQGSLGAQQCQGIPWDSALRWGNFRAGPASPVPAPLEIFYGHLKGLGTTWAALRRIRKVLAHQLQEWPAQQGWQDVVIVKAHQSQPSQTFNLSIVFLLDKSFSFSVAPILLSAASVGAMCVILGEARLKISWLSP